MSIGDFWYKHSPEILTGASVVGLVSTVYLAIKATPRAQDVVAEARERLQEAESSGEEKEIKKETIKDLAKLYLPTAISGAVTIACIVGSNHQSSVKNMALATAYSVSNKYIESYRDEVRDMFGDKKEREISQKASEKQARYSGTPPVVGDGDYLCFDTLANEYFFSTMSKIKDAIIDTNIQLEDDTEVTVSDLYYRLGAKTSHLTDIAKWRISKTRKIEEYYTWDGRPEDGRPMLIVHYYAEPEGLKKER